MSYSRPITQEIKKPTQKRPIIEEERLFSVEGQSRELLK